ncbi:rtc4-like domain-containing [Trichoderma arundinaceum]|uniref:Restriction of telomere capping protein 4 n=1 Tax=Trichoderma arundinaceum TaxID=490622 RepID=A0A395NS82_TRIAR|nr:rtc4-like domain-containing [Trichoderma arundinaceum]
MGTPPVRRVGLSYRDSPGRLLKSVKSNTETTTTIAAAPKPESRLRGGRPQIKVPAPIPDDIFAPPLASSDSEDDELVGNPEFNLESGRQPQPLDDSSDSDGPPRGEISSTNFTSLGQSGKRQSRRTRAQEEKAASQLVKEAEAPQPSKKRKRQSDASANKSKSRKNAPAEPDSSAQPSSSASHLTNDHGFTRQSRVKATFGKKTSGSQESRKSRASVEPSSAKFRPPPEFNDETPRKSSKFVLPDDDTFSSPLKNDLPHRLNLQNDDKPDTDDDDDDDDNDDAAVFSQPKSTTDDTDFVSKGKQRGKRKDNPLRPKKQNAAGKKEKDPTPDLSSPPAKFVMPAQLSDFALSKTSDGDDVDGNDFSDASSSDLSSLGSLFPDKDGQALCPWCGATVDMQQLKDFSKGKRLNVRMQTKFCESHKKKSAMATWESRSYPKVKWTGLEKRFKKHQVHLLNIINGEESHYRTALADKIEQGQARSMKKEENLNPGYYGPRGFNIMCDYLVKEFSDLLKKKAIHDKVIAGRGSAAFIQSVLVAELGVRLIMEDMHVSLEEAREILEESKALGELVHAEI